MPISKRIVNLVKKPDMLVDSDRWIWNSLNHVHYGLDVTWDIYIFLGTLFFAISMYDHPRLGTIFSISGYLSRY